MLKVASKILTI